jgi:group I intron endonuclease
VYRALLKYGYSKFTLEILEYCDKSSVIEKEQYYLDLLNPSYNIYKIGGSSLGRVTLDHNRLKLRRAWLVRLFKNKSIGLSFSEFILRIYERKVNKYSLNISKLQSMFEKITLKK